MLVAGELSVLTHGQNQATSDRKAQDEAHKQEWAISFNLLQHFGLVESLLTAETHVTNIASLASLKSRSLDSSSEILQFLGKPQGSDHSGFNIRQFPLDAPAQRWLAGRTDISRAVPPKARRCEASSDLPLVRDDRVQLQQVILNPAPECVRRDERSRREPEAAADPNENGRRRIETPHAPIFQIPHGSPKTGQ